MRVPPRATPSPTGARDPLSGIAVRICGGRAPRVEAPTPLVHVRLDGLVGPNSAHGAAEDLGEVRVLVAPTLAAWHRWMVCRWWREFLGRGVRGEREPTPRVPSP